MKLRSAVERLARSERAKGQIARAGRSPTGALWTAQEELVLRLLYPDYAALHRALKIRTYNAIKKRATQLGICRQRHRWTAAEISRLRKLYPKESAEDLKVAFPGLRLTQLRRMANYRGITKDRKPYAPTGIAVIDSIRKRAFELNLTMIDVDELAKTGAYFRDSRWRHHGVVAHKVCRAILALDGSIEAVWNA